MFDRLQDSDEIKEILKEAFDMELNVSGSWGYEREKPLIIEDKSMPVSQLQFVFASMRATLQMNLTQPKEKRYGGINLKELSRERVGELEMVEYEISAIKEDIYEELIAEYKKGYGKDEFDMDEHFKKREKNTIKTKEEFWFKLK